MRIAPVSYLLGCGSTDQTLTKEHVDVDQLLHEAIDKAQAMLFELELMEKEDLDKEARESTKRVIVLLRKENALISRARKMLLVPPP